MIISKKILAITLAVLIIVVLGYMLFLKKGANKAEKDSGQILPNSGTGSVEKTEAAPLSVKASAAQKSDLIIKLKSPGEAFTDKKIVMKAEVQGMVKNLNVREGKHVREGELLVELDDQEYRLKLEKQQALRLKYLSELFLEKQFAAPEKELSSAFLEKLNQAREDYEKTSELFQKGLLSKADFEKAGKNYELILIESGRKKEEIMAVSKGLTQAEIDVKMAQIELGKTKVLAPFSGIITDIKISTKEFLDRGRELFILVNISQIKVKAKVLESEVGKMKVGREVDLKFSAYPDKIFKGRVEAVSPIINPEDKTCAVHITMANPAEEIKPGMHAEVEIASEIYKNRLLVPQEAVLVRGGRKLVFVVESGLAKWRYIEAGLENEDYVEILEGVKEGELVITEGHLTLAHDARVSIKE